MDDAVRLSIIEKNRRLIDMVVERAKRDFPDDIALIGLTGSFSTGDFHEKSDLDLIIVNDTPRGFGISRCFILGDVGYDIYCTPWSPRIEAEAALKSPMVSCLVDLQILYCAKPEYMERFESCRRRALLELAKPIGPDCLERAARGIEAAKARCADALLSDGVGPVRYAAGLALLELTNAVVSMNNTYFKRGVKRYLEELRGLEYVPEDFEAFFLAVVRAETVPELRAAVCGLLRGVVRLHEEMLAKFTPQPSPTPENMAGTYEELWCNYRNKVISSADGGDAASAFLAAVGAQDYLDEMSAVRGTRRFDVMALFTPSDLPAFKAAFLRLMDDYLEEYRRIGLAVDRFDDLDSLYESFMRPGQG